FIKRDIYMSLSHTQQQIPVEEKQFLDKKEEKMNIDDLCSFVCDGNLPQLKKQLEILKTHSEKSFQEVFQKRSSEGLTLTAYALIYNKDDIFAFLANHKEYDSKSDGALSIILPDKMESLLKTYHDSFVYSRLITLLQRAIVTYNHKIGNYFVRAS